MKVPYLPLPSLLTDQVWVSLTSTSVLPSWPVALVLPPSVTSPEAWPLMTGASLVPLMVTVTVPLVPSAVTTSKVSVSFSPAQAWTLGSLLSSSYFQLPLASIENLPCSP